MWQHFFVPLYVYVCTHGQLLIIIYVYDEVVQDLRKGFMQTFRCYNTAKDGCNRWTEVPHLKLASKYFILCSNFVFFYMAVSYATLCIPSPLFCVCILYIYIYNQNVHFAIWMNFAVWWNVQPLHELFCFSYSWGRADSFWNIFSYFWTRYPHGFLNKRRSWKGTKAYFSVAKKWKSAANNWKLGSL